jgi:hypothetical protein
MKSKQPTKSKTTRQRPARRTGKSLEFTLQFADFEWLLVSSKCDSVHSHLPVTDPFLVETSPYGCLVAALRLDSSLVTHWIEETQDLGYY